MKSIKSWSVSIRTNFSLTFASCLWWTTGSNMWKNQWVDSNLNWNTEFNLAASTAVSVGTSSWGDKCLVQCMMPGTSGTGETRGALRCLSDNKQGWFSGRDVLCHVTDSQEPVWWVKWHSWQLAQSRNKLPVCYLNAVLVSNDLSNCCIIMEKLVLSQTK